MVFGESPIKDLYRRLVWGPYRELLGRMPAGSELRANRRLGHLASLGARSKARRVRQNMSRAFPGRHLDPLVRQVFETHFVDQYISWTFKRIAAGVGSAYLDLRGVKYVDSALSKGKGVVLIHPHMGPAQLPLCELGALGYPVLQIGGGGVQGELSEEGRRVTALRHALEQDIPGRIQDGGATCVPSCVLCATTRSFSAPVTVPAVARSWAVVWFGRSWGSACGSRLEGSSWPSSLARPC